MNLDLWWAAWCVERARLFFGCRCYASYNDGARAWDWRLCPAHRWRWRAVAEAFTEDGAACMTRS